MMTGYSVMITPENVMMRTRFLGAMGMFYFRTIERRGNRRKVYDDEQIFQYYNE